MFREIILNSISSFKSSKVIICSGFFSEGKRFKLSQEGNFANIIKNNNIDLITIGVYSKLWQYIYQNFINAVKKIVGVKFTAYLSRQKWHAKVFFLKKESNYLITIIGSSNMTSSAFGMKKVSLQIRLFWNN